MRIDLLHNKIIKDTATDAFIASAESALAALAAEAVEGVEAILMYEDHIADGFSKGGYWYYPLTVISGGEADVLWVKWKTARGSFANASPYSYTGASAISFSLAPDVPEEFVAKMAGRAISYDESAMKVNVRTTAEDPLILVGKYSQTFVDELARQLTAVLERAMAVKGIAKSGIELEIMFAPGTYMEHTSENVTYRRLLIVDGASAPRDFWVKWTRIGGGVAYTVSDDVSAYDIVFELGEDVAQKIREKEFRFLCSSNPSKYQLAMGKKMVTEWRDIIKRAVRRGDLEKVEIDLADDGQDEVNVKLEEVLTSLGAAPVKEESAAEVPDGDFSSIMDLVRNALESSESTAKAESEEIFIPDGEPTDIFGGAILDAADEHTPVPTEDEPVVMPSFEMLGDAPVFEAPVFDEPVAEVDEPVADEPAVESDEPVFEAPVDAPVFDFSVVDEAEEDEPDAFKFEIEAVASPATHEEETEENDMNDNYRDLELRSEEAIRREVEAKIRLEYEAEARARAEAELERLRKAQAALKEENERLAVLARTAQAQHERALKDQQESAMRAKATEERLRAELEAKMQEEARERDRLAEAARIAVEEQRRKEAAEREEAARREAERIAREEEARREAERAALEAARNAEAERIRREMEERARAEAAAKAAAEEAAAKAAAEAAAAEEAARKAKALVSRHAKIIFRHPVDLNMISSIKEVVEQTLVKQGKENIHIHIKAYQESKETINLEILRLPESEHDLLVAIVKAIGNAKIGVSKIIVE